MKGEIFIDTNVWLYAFMEENSKKSFMARKLINENTEKICLSTQVLNEICINLIKKANYSEKEIRILIKNIDDTYKVYPIKVEDSIKASEIRDKLYISYWDSLIIASALNNECVILYSEDMQHNQKIQNQIKIINPFSNIQMD